MIAAWVVAVGFLLLLSSVLSAAEVSVSFVGAARVRTLVEEGFDGAERLARVRERFPALQTPVRLLITILDLLAVGLAVAFGGMMGGVRGSLAALAGIVVAVLLIGEILPRALAARRPIRMALASAPLLLVVERLVGGLLAPIVRLEDALAGRSEDADPEEREVRELADLGREEGVVGHDEHALVERAFRLDELTAFDVMVPRVDIFAWPAERTLGEIIPELGSVPYSRVPVYRESIDDVSGILYVREAYENWAAGRRDVTVGSLAREPFFVPGSISLARLLGDFQAHRLHMGIVADEYGGTDGLVTLEDVLEELVGEIVDETDIDEEPLLRVGRDTLVADGSVNLREVNYVFNVSLPTLDNRSLNGFILDELGYVPPAGEIFDRLGVRLEVLESTGTQVVRARLTRLGESADEDEEG